MNYFDTLKSVNDLTNTGMGFKQAEILTGMYKDLIENQYGHLANKQDLEKVSMECKNEIFEVKMEVKSINSEIKTIKWILGVFAAVVMANFVQHNLMH